MELRVGGGGEGKLVEQNGNDSRYELDPFLSVLIPIIKFSGSHSSSFTSHVLEGWERGRGGDLRVFDIRGGSRSVEYGFHTRKKRREWKEGKGKKKRNVSDE